MTTAFLTSRVVHTLTGSEVSAAYGGVVGELVGFYGTIIGRDLLAEFGVAAHEPSAGRGQVARVRAVLGRVAVELGPAELLDSTALRPLAMGIGTRYLGRAWGVALGKLVADLAFYSFVVISQGYRRRHVRVGATAAEAE